MIDYSLIAHALKYYEFLGYRRIETPWLVSKEINNITAPKDVEQYYVYKGGKEKTLVASGEQSFLYLINKGFLPKEGRFVTCTPCFRNEDFDLTHSKYFLKVELIVVGESVESYLNTVKLDCRRFFDNYVKCEEIQTDIGYDLIANGIEVGSYGIRSVPGLATWVYGTGLAEPRFSRVMNGLSQQ